MNERSSDEPAPLHGRFGQLGLGCMRLSTDADRDDGRALATLEAALAAGVRVFDTARAYGHGDAELGHNERLLAEALAGRDDVAVVTKGGMRRPSGGPRRGAKTSAAGWRPDGRGKTLRADAEASAEALGRPADLWLLHALDPRVELGTSARAMNKILSDGTARAVGVCNVDRTRLERLAEHAPITAVQVALSPWVDEPLGGGVVEWCAARGASLLAHSPFGGPTKAGRVAKDALLRGLAEERGESPFELVLAWLRALGPCVVPLPGARRPESARACGARAPLSPEHREALYRRFDASRFAGPRAAPTEYQEGEVVLVMGVPGAGKSRAATRWVERGYERLNRDERGGTLRGLTLELRRRLEAGGRRFVLDNTDLSRAQRAAVIGAAWDHGLPVRCVRLDIDEGAAQLNVCLRLLEQHEGELPAPEALRRSRAPGVFGPTRHQRMVRELEPPELAEGFAVLEPRPFERVPFGTRAGVIVPLDAAVEAHLDVPSLMLGWTPGEAPPPSPRAGVTVASCPHPAGPPVCWCRPPLPGLVARWLRAESVDPGRVEVRGGGSTFAALARALGARHVP